VVPDDDLRLGLRRLPQLQQVARHHPVEGLHCPQLLFTITVHVYCSQLLFTCTVLFSALLLGSTASAMLGPYTELGQGPAREGESYSIGSKLVQHTVVAYVRTVLYTDAWFAGGITRGHKGGVAV